MPQARRWLDDEDMWMRKDVQAAECNTCPPTENRCGRHAAGVTCAQYLLFVRQEGVWI
jgi:hypothetical protein